jgi:hypothetical protein
MPLTAAHHLLLSFLQPSRARKQAAAKPRRAPKRPAGLVNLKGLIDEGLMQPGDDVLTVEYKGTLTHASLTHDGRIRWKGVLSWTQEACSSSSSSSTCRIGAEQ